MIISGYTIQEKIFESERSLVYRGIKNDDSASVILKVLRKEQVTPERIGRFHREFNIMQRLKGDDCIRAYDLIEFENSLAIVLEDFGGQSIAAALRQRPMPLPQFFPLAIKITQQLGDIHNENLIHKDINPGNIVWNQESDAVKIIDFGLATSLSRENPQIRNPNVLEGTLAYISPEQSGRMNRAVDYRSDFYSLGVTFYELLTGMLPFNTKDPMELVHAHIAKQPISPTEHNKNIPIVISKIITRLLNKNAEERYQSAFGLRRDLEQCWEQWQDTQIIAPFPLGEHDVYAHFQMPQKLYGRFQDRQLILDTFTRIADNKDGQIELILVTGQAGIGKSSLIQELYKPVSTRYGNFIQGKYDQLQNTPYAPLIAAFESLIHQILAGTEAEIAQWKNKLYTSLGNNGQLIIDVIPALQFIIGPQPPLPELPPAEAENRFKLTFLAFIASFAQIDHPLVLFLDDWQWMDAASRQLLESLFTSGDTHHLLLIGAYRDDEMPPEHPVWSMLAQAENGNLPRQTIVLQPLATDAVNQFVADTLHISPTQTKQLSEIIFNKTGGNPFFVGEFLKRLYTDELISFNVEHGLWEWEMTQVEAQEMTDNVVSLMMSNIQQLDAHAQQVLMLAACIGSHFDLEQLAIAFERPLPETAVSLWEALVAGLVIPLDEDYNLATIDVFGYRINTHYRFSHDRIQQAAYALIPEEEKKEIHWQLGQHLLANFTNEELEARLFIIVNHLNLGQEQLSNKKEQLNLIQLNLSAGHKAAASAAYHPAFAYYETGIRLTAADENFWQTSYPLALDLFTAATTAAYISTHYNQMEQYGQVVINNSTNLLDTIPIYKTYIDAYTVQNRMQEAIKITLPILQKLGINLPPKPNTAHLGTAVLQVKLALRGKTIESLLDLPLMTDPQVTAAIELMSRVGVPAYFVNTQLFALIVLKSVQLYIKYGNHPQACRVYVSYGILLCGPLNDIESGYKFGQLGFDLVEKLHAKDVKAATWHLMNNHVRFWKDNLNDCLPQLVEAYHTGLETGDLQFALFAIYAYCGDSLLCGRELNHLLTEMETYSKVMMQHSEVKIHYIHCMYQQAAANLLGHSASPHQLQGAYYDETITVPEYKRLNDGTALGAFYIQKGLLGYLFGEYTIAQQSFADTQMYLDNLVGANLIPIYHFYSSLTQIQLSSHNDGSKPNHIKIAKKHLSFLKKWKSHAPENYAHKHWLIAAELARVNEEWGTARELYDRAIDLAEQHHFPNEAALGYELAGKFYLDQDNGRLAQHYLQQARLAYMRWGAQAKVHQLEADYPQLTISTVDTSTVSISLSTASPVTSTGIRTTSELDITSAIKASQALSEEIVLDKLLDRLMAVLIENAGAQTGFLLLQEADTWHIKSFWGDGATDETALPFSIINYVARTQQAVVLDDAANDGTFAQDPIIQVRQPQSILCLPLTNQAQLSGILYLENDLATGVFTDDRLTLLNLLASQAAISIENAQLYGRLEEYSHTLEQKVEQRTVELAQATQEADTARAAAEAASANKSAFLANMSHELRTPLNAIIGFTRIVKRRSKDVLPEKQRDNLDKVLQSSDHLLNLINTILDIAKIEAGRMDVQPQQFSIYPLVDACVATTQPLLKPTVVLNKQMAPDLPSMINDQARIRQILINLLSNAAKFTPNGRITLAVHQEEDDIIFAVIDTGIGIPEEALPRVFEEFQQADKTTRQTYGGTGLGLPISRTLARLLHGDLTATSQVGKGSVFALKVPIVYAE